MYQIGYSSLALRYHYSLHIYVALNDHQHNIIITLKTYQNQKFISDKRPTKSPTHLNV